ncbi:MAG: CaiB/BaiF CoA transferase family protein [Myxococcota bacterium]
MSEQALSGLKVVEFTQGMAGPWIGRMLAWCGAQVVRIETREAPGVVRLYIPPTDRAGGIQPTRSPWLTDWDGGKLFVSLNLKRPGGLALAKRLIAWSDVVVENHRHGAMERLGLSWDTMQEANPSLIALHSSGFGDGGVHPDYVTWGPNVEAMSGMAAASGFPHREGAMTQYAYPDSLSALHGLFAVLCALDHRDRTGESQRITLAQFETTTAMLGPLMMQQIAEGHASEKQGNRSLHRAPQGCYPCLGEDRWCALSIGSLSEWETLCHLIDRPEWSRDETLQSIQDRLEQADTIDEAISAWTQQRTAHEAAEQFQAAGLAAGAVQNTEDQYTRDPHLAERGYFERIPHLTLGEVVAPGIPLGLTATPGGTSRAGADLGEDNLHVFRDLLGLSEQEYDEHIETGAIEESPTKSTT